ncbi:methyl-accepting chemotaxis protein [Roseateles koreensis]|uniref:Methyl-accepting chemotaxis protein n=1 Tax=Roseateles koreensis TaxID=2987526 RepID=A0ABT5KTZ3_9BURK|nr:methyl-accepting chemotaxis protein [Roseateles koreensis]MDC8786403.1 methyl-accepting chemotaxis protein [Roseateles koreensis]
MNSWTLARSLRAALACTLLAFVGVIGFLSWRSEQSLLELRLNETVSQVQAADRIAQQWFDKAHSGAISDAEARQSAAEAIGKIRYSGKEYLWINDMGPTMVMHPIKPELNGKDLTNSVDPTGKRLFVEMVATVKASKAGFVDYLWNKPDAKDPEPKRSYVQLFAPWNWVIGSGVYVDEVAAIARRDAYVTLALVLLASLLAWLGIELFVRRLRSRLDTVRNAMEAVAHGDLSRTVVAGPADEVGHVLDQLIAMQARLAHMVQGIRDATESIGVASREVASGSQDLSSRTEDAAANLQRTSASMRELTEQVQQTAEAARQTHQLANNAASQAQRGASVMTALVSSMGNISTSSGKISDIISVIDGVAFQTNILALNAAVEAARAGEQGRGFAVVASEVRSLAGRSAEAAKEIKRLINDSTEQVAQGSAQAERSGQSMNEILDSVQRVTRTVSEISDAGASQYSGIAEVNSAVTRLDDMTQQNAALVEQTAAAAESLRSQAETLGHLVAVFRLSGARHKPNSLKPG